MSQMIHRHSRVPPGFRFHPTDEELVGYYLHKKVSSRRIDLDVIREIDLYKMEPWDLQEKCRIGSAEQTEWYFFSHKDKKYPTGTRTNRATTAGFWKATGRDKTIHTKFSFVGMRKTLVFYKGRAPNGQKTDWIMHEYRLEDEQNNSNSNVNINCNQDQDGWVVCRVFKKKVNLKGQKSDCGYEDQGLIMQEMSLPIHGMHHQIQQQQQFACKQEFSSSSTHHHRLEDFSGYNNVNDAFSRLPQLESPRSLACVHPPSGFSMKNNSISSSSFPAAESSSIIMRNNYPPAFSLEAIEFDSAKNTPDDHHHHPQQQQQQQSMVNLQAEQFTDWRAVDKLAAAQLSQEQAMKEMRFLEEGDEYSGDVALLLRLSKQEIEGASVCGDGELWNFGRDNTI